MQRDETRIPTVDQFVAALLGLGIGDALGRPTEGKRQDEIRAWPRAELLTFRGYRDGRLGLRCIDNVCSKLHAAGQKCGSDSDCAAGLWCDGFGKCAQRGFVQAVCQDDHQCADGLWCDRSPEGGLCRSQIATGQTCTAGSAEAIVNACVPGDV